MPCVAYAVSTKPIFTFKTSFIPKSLSYFELETHTCSQSKSAIKTCYVSKLKCKILFQSVIREMSGCQNDIKREISMSTLSTPMGILNL